MQLDQYPAGAKVQIGDRIFQHLSKRGLWREDHLIPGNRVTRPTASLERLEESVGPHLALPIEHGYFVDWNGDTRPTSQPGEHLECIVDVQNAHADIRDSEGFVIHECTFFPTLESASQAGCT